MITSSRFVFAVSMLLLRLSISCEVAVSGSEGLRLDLPVVRLELRLRCWLHRPLEQKGHPKSGNSKHT